MDKRRILLISDSDLLKEDLEKSLGFTYQIVKERSVHASYHLALSILPEIIVLDTSSLKKVSDFKNLKNFKSTHYLKASVLIIWCDEESLKNFRSKFDTIIDEFISNENIDCLAAMIERIISRPISEKNVWKEYFLGLFNLMPQPVLLLEQNKILAMNDSFKKVFKIEDSSDLQLTDFVNIENKAKVKTSLKKFARGKHFKAVTKTSLLLSDDKIRNAKINFSKLSREIDNQFVMIIDFEENRKIVDQPVGTISQQIDNCFKKNSQLTNYSFTVREKEIISLLCKGYKSKEISEKLFISPKTIEKHRANIIKRTNSETILESIIYAINHKLIEI
ncbi:helix-turn-helix transcriptional regulator [Gramella sp. AN32]|uniref:Response regulator transcription factor n=1 Tax=Christiangramia antarctica TaxID=2058158 RepID=A0ABW5X582_9FLAO|nr:helix-turn-helix transcriptional regulator [Gramella sp. AN32]MCM4157150.1 helix-turn-helix transcriptional regulator [Gramella sp. AN32]